MSRYTGPKCKKCRREGQKLFLKGTKCYTDKCSIEKKGVVPPGEPPKRVRPRATDYGIRLREKQRLKRSYGVSEAQFRRYVMIAKRKKKDEDFGTVLLRQLETRLDNVVKKLGFCWSLNQARQLVSHGHVLVDDHYVDIPSYNIRQGELVRLAASAGKLAFVQEALDKIPTDEFPDWLVRQGDVGKVLRLPKKEELSDSFDIGLIAELY